jgi:hypothetical protein
MKNMQNTTRRITFGVAGAAVLLAVLLACSGGGPSPTQVVQDYLKARVESDETKMVNLSCVAWEAQARIEAVSFKSMKASLDGVSCKDAGTNSGYTLVACQGKIVTSYNGESREWSVAERQFKVRQENSEWRMCGYQ